jgi:3-(3-hydroxy-phenyl)propionate hydroxylase
MVPGAPACDAPVMRDGQRDWLLRHLGGRFVAMRFADRGDTPIRHANAPDADGIRVDTLDVAPPDASARVPADVLVDVDGFVASRYDATPGTTYLFRPDQHVCARWRRFDSDAIRAAVARAMSSRPRP